MTGRLAVVDHPPVYIYTRTALDCRSVTSPSFFFLLSFSRPWRLTSNKLSSGTVSPTNSAAGYQPRLFLSKLLCRISTALNLIPLLVQRLWSVFITAGQERKRDLLCPTNRLFNFLRRERGVRYLGTRASLSSVDDFFSSFFLLQVSIDVVMPLRPGGRRTAHTCHWVSSSAIKDRAERNGWFLPLPDSADIRRFCRTTP